MNESSDDSRIDDYLDALEEAWDRGQKLQPADVCKDAELLPELEEKFSKLFSINRLMQVGSGSNEALAEPEDNSREQRIGPYQLLDPIGQGGMGTVWLAQQFEPIRRQVALKLITNAQPDQKVIARFEAERQTLASMDHPNIAKVLDAGETESGAPYFVMEFVEGVPINRFCDERRLRIEQRLELFLQICEAIQHAHTKGIIHRDIKPNNVLVAEYDNRPVVKVIDFGIAKALETDPADKTLFTDFGQVLGTYLYMSPEQAKVSTVALDTRTDIFSLGVLLHELLTGETPISAETLSEAALLELLSLISSQEPSRPSEKIGTTTDHSVIDCRSMNRDQLVSIMRGDIDAILMKATSNEPERRYRTADAFAEDLRRFLNSDPVEAREPTVIYRLAKFYRKNRGLVAALSTIVLLLIGGIAGTSIGLFKARIQQRRADEKANKAILAEELAKSNAEMARKAENATRFQLANARFKANRAAEAVELLEQIPETYRDNFEWPYCRQRFQGSYMTLYGHRWVIVGLDFSHDGSKIATCTYSEIKIWDAKTGEELATIPKRTSGISSVQFSPDGTTVASGHSDGSVNLWDSRSGQNRSQLIYSREDRTGGSLTIAFSPDGSKIASGELDGFITVWNIMRNEQPQVWKAHAGAVYSARFNSDGTRLVSGGSDRFVKTWDVETGEMAFGFKGHDDEVVSVDFSSDNRLIASASFDETVKVWDAQNGDERKTFSGYKFGARSVRFSPDGEQIVVACQDKTIKIWKLNSAAAPTVLAGHTEPLLCVDFSPDGKRIASAGWDCLVKVWDIRNSDPQTVLRGHRGAVNQVDVCRDGRRIASAGKDKSVRIWDTGLDEKPITALGHQDEVLAVSFSPDGTLIASGSQDQTVKIWNADAGKELFTLEGHNAGVNNVSFGPKGKLLATGGRDHQIKIWNLQSRKIQRTIQTKSWINGLCFHPDGDQIAANDGERKIQVWNIETGKIELEFEGEATAPYDLSYSPDGTRLIACCRRDFVSVWDARTGRFVRELNGHERQVYAARFSTDGQRIASVGSDRLLKFWDASNGEEKLSLTGHQGDVLSVAVQSPSKNLRRMVTGGSDGTVRIWNSHSVIETRILYGHSGLVRDVCFSPDGLWIASAGFDREVIIWQRSSGDIIHRLKDHQDVVLSVDICPENRRVVSSDGNGQVIIHELVSGEQLLTVHSPIENLLRVRFDSTGSEIHGEGENGELVSWNAKTGHSLKINEWRSRIGRNLSPDGRWLVVSSGAVPILVDREFSNLPFVNAMRSSLATIDPGWHAEKAASAARNENWLSASIHHGWVLASTDDKPSQEKTFLSCYQQLRKSNPGQAVELWLPSELRRRLQHYLD